MASQMNVPPILRYRSYPDLTARACNQSDIYGHSIMILWKEKCGHLGSPKRSFLAMIRGLCLSISFGPMRPSIDHKHAGIDRLHFRQTNLLAKHTSMSEAGILPKQERTTSALDRCTRLVDDDGPYIHDLYPLPTLQLTPSVLQLLTEILSLIVDHHARLLAFSLHISCHLLRSSKYSKNVFTGETSKISSRPSTSVDEFGELCNQ